MALNCKLTGGRPGEGEIEVTGSMLSGDVFELAVQRSTDERYLGARSTWQTTPYWHRVERIAAEPGSIRLMARAGIIDGLLGSVGAALRVLLRAGGREEQGMLRVKGLLGSEAADQTRIMPPRRIEEETPAPLELPPQLAAPAPALAPPPRRRAWRLLSLLVVLAAAGLSGAWYLGWLGSWLRPVTQPPETIAKVEPGEAPKELSPPTPQAPAPGPPAPAERTSPTPAPPAAKGLARARELLATGPSPQSMYQHARQWDQAGDCEAAVPLYARAAGADPAVAAEVAHHYDPEGFKPSPCIEEPDEGNAALWYEDAARAGDPKAQGRLGAILTARAASGPIHDDGIEWLRKAAEAGNARAKQQLSDLGQP